MFERMMERLSQAAERRVRRIIAGETERLTVELPHGIGAERMADGIRLRGRALRRRFALEAALRRLLR